MSRWTVLMGVALAIVATLAVALLTARSIRADAIEQVETQAAQDAAHIGHIFYYSVWAPINEQVPGLTFADAMYPQILEVFARRSTFGLSVTTLDIHGLDGALLWSSSGESMAHALPPAWDAAAQGRSVSSFEPAAGAPEGDAAPHDSVRTYLPFRDVAPDAEGPQGTVLGVIEIAQDVSGTVPSLSEAASGRALVPGLIAGGLVLALAVAVSVAAESRIARMRRRVDRREARIEELQEQRFQSTKLATVGEIVANVAHEINNPLTAIWGLSQVLLQRDLDPKVNHEVQLIHDEAERSTRIVQNLLSYARARHSEKAYTSINAAVNAAVELRHYHLLVNNVALDLDLDPALPRTMADPHKIQQVIINLLINAEQAMLSAHGGGKLMVRTRAAGGRIRLMIEDDGPGISPEVRDRIFDPFFTTKSEGNGTGLGLSICYSIVEEHGGTITPEDAPAGGTAFVIDLPVISADDAPATKKKHDRKPEHQIAVPRA